MKIFIGFLLGLAVGVYVSDTKPEWADYIRTASSESVESAQKLLK